MALWTYSLRQETYLRNFLPDKEDDSSTLERFSKISVAPKFKRNHLFGCPVFSLQRLLTGGGGGICKWEPRAWLGINLGSSPRHAGYLSLIINLQTLMVYPQFYINYDDYFDTLRPTTRNPPTYYNWKLLIGLRKHKNPVRDPKYAVHQQVDIPKAVITREEQHPPTVDK